MASMKRILRYNGLLSFILELIENMSTGRGISVKQSTEMHKIRCIFSFDKLLIQSVLLSLCLWFLFLGGIWGYFFCR